MMIFFSVTSGDEMSERRMKLNEFESCCCCVEYLLILFTFANGDVVLEFEENNDDVDDVDGCLMRFDRGVISTDVDLLLFMFSEIAV